MEELFILVIEDEPLIQAMIDEALRDGGRSEEMNNAPSGPPIA